MKRKRSRTKEIVKTKRVRKNPIVKLIKTEFYTCNQTLKDGNGNICFRKGGEYMLQRFAKANIKMNDALLLASEVWGMHVVKLNSWGSSFVKTDRVESFTQQQRDDFANETLVKYKTVTSPTRRRRNVLSDEKPQKVKRVRSKVETSETKPKRMRVKKGGTPYGILHPEALEKAKVTPTKRKRIRLRR